MTVITYLITLGAGIAWLLALCVAVVAHIIFTTAIIIAMKWIFILTLLTIDYIRKRI